jgi:hypothetical protein
MIDLSVQLDADGTWLCKHAEPDGRPAPTTRLRLDRTHEWNPGYPTHVPRRGIRCSDCGTYWCVWERAAVAKPTTDWNSTERLGPSPRYRPAPIRDIDRVIELVTNVSPEISVIQHGGTWPGDDDGLWWFRLPNVDKNIQLESSGGMCPFIVEHDDMKSSHHAWHATTAEQAAEMVIAYLRGADDRGPSLK